MDIKKLTQEVLLKNMTPEQQLAVLDSVTASVREAKAVQKQKIAENVDLVLQALKRIESDMLKRVQDSSKTVEDRVKTIKDGKDGKDGLQGAKGEKGDRGFDGKDGRNGRDGKDGKDGIDGVNGVGVANAHIDFDGSLIITLSTGQELNVGEVVSPELSDKIKVVANGGGTSQYVLDLIAQLQAEIDAITIPSQTGNAGKFLGTTGTDLQWQDFPDLTITDTFVVNTQAAMLALSAQKGDVAVRTDLSKTFILTASPASTLGDWQELLTPTDLVTSVAGRTGNVVLSNSDVSGSAASGANSDITSLSGITGGIATADYLQLDTTITPSVGVAKLQWDTTWGGPQVGMEGGNVNLQIGQETLIKVYNNTGSSLTDGQVVYVTGSQGQRLTVALAKANADSTSATIIGMVTEPIANNASGFVTTQGMVNGLNTVGATDGAVVYLSPTTAGAWTTTKPVAPQHLVMVGYVVKGGSGGAGSIYVNTQNGYELEELHNVLITSAANGDVLRYNSVSGVWENVAQTSLSLNSSQVTTALGYTPYNSTNPSGYTSNTGTVTSVGGTGTVSGLSLSGTVTTSGNLTLEGTLAVTPSNFASQTANTVLAAPNGASGVPTFRALVAADVPTLNQNTTGSAGSLVTTGFSIVESGGKLLFKYGATTIASMSSTGVITSATNIVSNGTP